MRLRSPLRDPLRPVLRPNDGTGVRSGTPDTTFRLTGTPPPATVGVAYSWTPGVRNGVAPIVFALTGDLPDGLSFDTGTGTISGTPTEAWSGSITIDAVDDTSAEASTTRTLLVLEQSGFETFDVTDNGGEPFMVLSGGVHVDFLVLVEV